MLYIAYLDEFGHIGPYISHDHHKHKTHPIFGLGGVVLPYTAVRSFATFFYQLKCNLLKWEIDRSTDHSSRWEKKGSSLYTVANVEQYRELRVATNRLLNQIKTVGGYVFYVGLEKPRSTDNADAKKLYHHLMKEALKRLDQECAQNNDQFMVILDQQEENVLRPEIVKYSAMEMYGSSSRKTLIEPPIQAESHLYQTIQCADWICGIVGRLAHYHIEPEVKSNYECIDKYFKARVDKVAKRSTFRRCRENPASEESLNKLAGKFNGCR